MCCPIRHGVVDLPHRAAVGQRANERYLEAVAGLAETTSVKDLAEPLTRRVPGPKGTSTTPARQVRGLNPLAAEDAALLAAISDPKWMITGVRNRDVAAILYPNAAQDTKERRAPLGARHSPAPIAACPRFIRKNTPNPPLPNTRRGTH